MMGYEINTLTMILIALVVLAIMYVCLEYGGKKEGFQTSANAIVGLLGTNFDKEITDTDVRTAVNLNGDYDERYHNALKSAVCALYKATTGTFKLIDIAHDSTAMADMDPSQLTPENLDDVLQEKTPEMQETCQSVIEMQPLLENIIATLSSAPANLCGEAFSSAVKHSEFSDALDRVKKCKTEVIANLQSSPPAHAKKAIDFIPVFLNEVIACLDKLNAELTTLEMCDGPAKNTNAAAGAAPSSGTASSTESTPAAVSNVKTTSVPTAPTQDNYNHYTGSYMPAVFYGPDGSMAKVKTSAQGNATIITTDNQGGTATYSVKRDNAKSNGAQT